jgi:hypothetical protein
MKKKDLLKAELVKNCVGGLSITEINTILNNIDTNNEYEITVVSDHNMFKDIATITNYNYGNIYGVKETINVLIGNIQPGEDTEFICGREEKTNTKPTEFINTDKVVIYKQTETWGNHKQVKISKTKHTIAVFLPEDTFLSLDLESKLILLNHLREHELETA